MKHPAWRVEPYVVPTRLDHHLMGNLTCFIEAQSAELATHHDEGLFLVGIEMAVGLNIGAHLQRIE
jgi:hypothetical protein